MKHQELILKSNVLNMMAKSIETKELQDNLISWIQRNVVSGNKPILKKVFFEVAKDLFCTYFNETQNNNKVPEEKIKLLTSLHQNANLTQDVHKQQALNLELIKLINKAISEKAQNLSKDNKTQIYNVLYSEFKESIEHTQDQEGDSFYQQFKNEWECGVEIPLIGEESG